MPVSDKERRSYLKQVEKCLVCSRRDKKRIIKDLNENIDEMLLDKPMIDIKRLEWEMGKPEKIASDYLNNTSIDAIKREYSLITIIRVICFCIFVLLALYGVFRLYWAKNRVVNTSTLTREVVVEMVDGVETTRFEYSMVKENTE